jgi:hypothetical protein
MEPASVAFPLKPVPSLIEDSMDSNSLFASNEFLISVYSEQMHAIGLPWRVRDRLARAAEEFLRWWRDSEHGTCQQLRPLLASQTEEWNLRERYLRCTIPDRDERASERVHVQALLNFIGASGDSEPYSLIAPSFMDGH